MNVQTILNCEIKDDTGLNDFQKLPSLTQIMIPKVGIERFRIPMNFKHQDGEVMSHDTHASMFIELHANKTGANMSRFPAILQQMGYEQVVVDNLFFEKVLKAFRSELRDDKGEPLIKNAYLGLKFSYPIKQPSLKSDNWGWQYYDCELEAELGTHTMEKTIMSLTLDYEYSSTCPCSLSMAKQYEKSFRMGEIKEGNGIATAHSQRSLATVQIKYDSETPFHIENLIQLLRKAIPTETQSLVKRTDEQAFAILNGENPMFVEHVARRLSVALNNEAQITDWNVKIEHFESLHSHNAVAYIHK